MCGNYSREETIWRNTVTNLKHLNINDATRQGWLSLKKINTCTVLSVSKLSALLTSTNVAKRYIGGLSLLKLSMSWLQNSRTFWRVATLTWSSQFSINLEKKIYYTYTYYESEIWLMRLFPRPKSHISKFFIMLTEFDKNISDWRHDCTDYKNDLDFFLRLVKWPKIAVKKSQIFQKF